MVAGQSSGGGPRLDRRTLSAALKRLPRAEAYTFWRSGMKASRGDGARLMRRIDREIRQLTRQGFNRTQAKRISAQRRIQRQRGISSGGLNPSRIDFIIVDAEYGFEAVRR